MIKIIKDFQTLDGTRTHVLLDSWYSAKAIWKAAREREFLITTALRANRSVRITDSSRPQGWCWQRLPDDAQSLPKSAFLPYAWPRDPQHQVWVHVLSSSVKSLYRCQLVIIRQDLDEPLKRTRFWASSDLKAPGEQLLMHIATRWDIEVFFEDAKELLGIDQYQLMSADGLLRSWSLCWIVYSFLEEHRAALQRRWQRHVTVGEAKRDLQRIHHRLLVTWITDQVSQGFTGELIADFLAA
jgi:SRSO17 transposase